MRNVKGRTLPQGELHRIKGELRSSLVIKCPRQAHCRGGNGDPFGLRRVPADEEGQTVGMLGVVKDEEQERSIPPQGNHGHWF